MTASQSAVIPLEPFGKARPRVTRGNTYMPHEYVRAMPASWPKRKRAEMSGAWCTSKPDADNIAGAVMDALFEDDAAVVEVACRKVWGTSPELRIEVRTAEAAA